MMVGGRALPSMVEEEGAKQRLRLLEPEPRIKKM
jgi:hypothetical protein